MPYEDICEMCPFRDKYESLKKIILDYQNECLAGDPWAYIDLKKLLEVVNAE